MCVGSLVVSFTSSASAYPPDNAAVLYYRAMLLYAEPEAADIWILLRDVTSGKADPNEKIARYVERNRYAMNCVITAAEIRKCDWGLDYSEGTSLLLPSLSTFRNLGRLLLADAAILQAKGDYKTALNRCLTAYKMARHIGNDLIIGHLVGTAIASLADESLTYILSQMPPDLQALKMLRTQLVAVEARPCSLKTAIETDAASVLPDITIERKEKILLVLEPMMALSGDAPTKPESEAQRLRKKARIAFEKMLAKRVRNADEKFLAANRQYWIDYTTKAADAVEMPYARASAILEQLKDKPKKDAAKNPGATLTAILAPTYGRVLTLDLRQKTRTNAIRVAVEIYIAKATTGQLPDALPAAMPKDLFSGKDFEYRKKDDGFILRCREKDLENNTVHKYQFKIAD